MTKTTRDSTWTSQLWVSLSWRTASPSQTCKLLQCTKIPTIQTSTRLSSKTIIPEANGLLRSVTWRISQLTRSKEDKKNYWDLKYFSFRTRNLASWNRRTRCVTSSSRWQSNNSLRSKCGLSPLRGQRRFVHHSCEPLADLATQEPWSARMRCKQCFRTMIWSICWSANSMKKLPSWWLMITI